MFKENAKHRANDASNDVHRPPLASPLQLVHKLDMEALGAVGDGTFSIAIL